MNFKFPHKAPKGYSYEVEQFKRNVLSIWVLNHGEFSYTRQNSQIHMGIYDTKTKFYHAPINATKQGDQVDIKNTTPYSAMQLNLNPLEAAFI